MNKVSREFMPLGQDEHKVNLKQSIDSILSQMEAARKANQPELAKKLENQARTLFTEITMHHPDVPLDEFEERLRVEADLETSAHQQKLNNKNSNIDLAN